ncbi:MAG: hypothetical protein JSS81_07095 [Acidobacteria bacterium]|nr:hypothetical protein [Acidobacteriota bacterium]
MKKNLLIVSLFLLLTAGFARAQSNTVTEVKTIGGIATLYALDPLAHTFCFADGREGYMFQQNEVRNRCSDLDYNAYNAGGLTVGNEGARTGAIVDLGGAAELARRYGYTETVGGGQGFASLRAADGKIFIVKDRAGRTEQEIAESALLFAGGKSGAKAAVQTGHLYLLRITDKYDKSFERLVKLIVLAHAPGESVTFRWQNL